MGYRVKCKLGEVEKEIWFLVPKSLGKGGTKVESAYGSQLWPTGRRCRRQIEDGGGRRACSDNRINSAGHVVKTRFPGLFHDSAHGDSSSYMFEVSPSACYVRTRGIISPTHPRERGTVAQATTF